MLIYANINFTNVFIIYYVKVKMYVMPNRNKHDEHN